MKLFSKLKGSLRKVIISSAVVATAIGIGAVGMGTAAAAGGDCVPNSVVWCGVTSASDANSKYDKGDGHNSAGSIHTIYTYFKISGTDVNNLAKPPVGYTTVKGEVYTDGTVKVDGKTVATDAITGGREWIAGGSTKHTINGTTFYSRKPSVSFKSSPLSAIVSMKDGVFQFAVLNSCGNPVEATPLKPAYNINKLVRVKGDSKYVNSVTVKSGTHVQYQITVSSTGKVPVLDTVVRDSLPAHITYVNNTLKRDGNAVSNDSAFFAKGITISKLNNGSKTVYTFEAIVGPKDTATSCTPESLTNTGYINSPSLPSESNSAGVKKECLPKPVYTCDQLTAVPTADPLTYTFNGKATAKNGAKITGYTFAFGDGTSKTVSSSAATGSLNHTYSKAGTYTAVLTAIFNVDGSTKSVTSTGCKAVVTIKPASPVYTCDSLTATPVSRTEYNFTGAATAKNGATITGYTFNFGDGQSTTTTVPTNTASHTYTAPGMYTATLTALVSVNGTNKTVTGPKCVAKVTIASPSSAQCTGLTATPGENRSATATVTYIAQNGAKLSSISYNFGDGSAPVVTTSTTANHTYAADGDYTIVATLSFTGTTDVADSTCQAPVSFTTVTPTYTCDELDVSQSSGRTVTITNFKTTATNGAVFTSADINWGDNSTVDNSATVIGENHQYAADGTYTINVIAHFTVNGQDVTASGPSCQKQVSFNTPPVTPPTTPPVTPPTTLVNTGAGSVAGIFAIATIAGTVAYRWFIGRRLSHDS